MTTAFTLGGKEYELSRAVVEERLEFVVPKPTDKYFVMIKGRPFPPKQVLSIALDLPLLKFTTMAANGILARLGYEVQEEKKISAHIKTESERLVEILLGSRGLDCVYEPEIQGVTAQPDFMVLRGNQKPVFLEVKEFQPTPGDFGGGFGGYDPYDPIRQKIHEALKNLAGLKSEICGVVLYNAGKPLVDLRWQFIYSAMLGRLSYSFPVNTTTGIGDTDAMTLGFTGGDGEMVRYSKDGQAIEPYKTRISAVIALARINVGERRFKIAVRRRECELGRETKLEEYLEMATDMSAIRSVQELRVVVCSNPYARLQFPQELFSGPYDEHFGPHQNHIQRTFFGDELKKLEDEEDDVGVTNHAPWKKLARGRTEGGPQVE